MSVAEAPSALDINDLRTPSPAWNSAVETPAEAPQAVMEQGIEPAVEVEAQAVSIEAQSSIEQIDEVISEPPAALSELVEASLAETSEMSQPDVAELSVEVEAETAFGTTEFAVTEPAEPTIEAADAQVAEVVPDAAQDVVAADIPAPLAESEWAADAPAVEDAMASLPDLSEPAESFAAFAADAAVETEFDRPEEAEDSTLQALAPEGLEAMDPVLVEEFDDEPLATDPDPDAVIALSPFDHATGERLAVVLEGDSTSLDALVEATDAQANALEVLEVLARRIRSGELQVAPAGTSEESVLASILAALLSHRP
ncbi:MAG: hypothetical protein JNL26_05170 [Gemmatimonadetes bacterium]|nr:hypothetical protein [Gemmatimonadota bacterium]